MDELNNPHRIAVNGIAFQHAITLTGKAICQPPDNGDLFYTDKAISLYSCGECYAVVDFYDFHSHAETHVDNGSIPDW